MSADILKLTETVAGEWSGVTPPNAPALFFTKQLDGVIAGFKEQRGAWVFESEPAQFDAALKAGKDL